MVILNHIKVDKMDGKQYLNIDIKVSSDTLKVSFAGSILEPGAYSKIEAIAASPIDRRMSYAGSGLPFPNADVAFEGTPNRIAIASPGQFSGEFEYPNRYYLADARTLISPSIFFVLTPIAPGADPIYIRYELPVPEELELRSLNHRSGRTNGPAFYSHKEDLIGIEGAERTMRLYADYKTRFNIA